VPALEILPYTPERAEDVVRVYNRGVVGLPYCATLDAHAFTRLIAPRFFFHPDGLLTAYRGGTPLGYVHATLAPSADREGEHPEVGTITALFFPPEDPDVGQRLLGAAERWLALRGVARVNGWGSGATGYPFYRGLLSGLEPVLVENHRTALAAFRAAGYAPYVQSYLLVSDFATPFPETPAAPAAETVISPRRFEGRWDADAWRGHHPLECRASVDGTDAGRLLFATLTRLSEQGGTGVGGIAALGVREPFRRRGVASLMMTRSLNHLFGAGARRCLVACHRTNEAAIATYRKFGFRPAALMVGHEKRLRR
jgi:GNAT superfamily N-acetyltransferase